MLGSLPISVQADIRKYHRLGDLNHKIVFLTVLGAGKSKIKVLQIRCPVKGSLPGSQMIILLLCPHLVEGMRRLSGVFSCKDINPIHKGSTLMT